jgi:hypothetical protein
VRSAELPTRELAATATRRRLPPPTGGSHARATWRSPTRFAIDLVFVGGPAAHLDVLWEDPGACRYLEGLGRFARVIRFDRRGTGLSRSRQRPADAGAAGRRPRGRDGRGGRGASSPARGRRRWADVCAVRGDPARARVGARSVWDVGKRRGGDHSGAASGDPRRDRAALGRGRPDPVWAPSMIGDEAFASAGGASSVRRRLRAAREGSSTCSLRATSGESSGTSRRRRSSSTGPTTRSSHRVRTGSGRGDPRSAVRRALGARQPELCRRRR